MSDFLSFWIHSTLATAIIAWFLAQLIKVVLVLVKDRKIDFGRFVGSGGMPSSHSAIVTSLSTAVCITEGYKSSAFAISVVLALVVMYDAAGVRRAAGQQAKILNKIVAEWNKSTYSENEKKLKELLGHTPKEVFAGALLGIVVGILRHV